MTINRFYLELTDGGGEDVDMEIHKVVRSRAVRAQCPREEGCGNEAFFSEELKWGAHGPSLLVWLTMDTSSGASPTLSSSQRDLCKP